MDWALDELLSGLQQGPAPRTPPQVSSAGGSLDNLAAHLTSAFEDVPADYIDELHKMLSRSEDSEPHHHHLHHEEEEGSSSMLMSLPPPLPSPPPVCTADDDKNLMVLPPPEAYRDEDGGSPSSPLTIVTSCSTSSVPRHCGGSSSSSSGGNNSLLLQALASCPQACLPGHVLPEMLNIVGPTESLHTNGGATITLAAPRNVHRAPPSLGKRPHVAAHSYASGNATSHEPTNKRIVEMGHAALLSPMSPGRLTIASDVSSGSSSAASSPDPRKNDNTMMRHSSSSLTAELMNEIASSLFHNSNCSTEDDNKRKKVVDLNSMVAAQLGTLQPCLPPPHVTTLTSGFINLYNSTDSHHLLNSMETDSGVESIDSLSPKDITPVCSPPTNNSTTDTMLPVSQQNLSTTPVLSTLLSTTPEPTVSSTLLNTLLNNNNHNGDSSSSSTTTSLIANLKPAVPAKSTKSISVVSINPKDMTLVSQGDARVDVEAAMDVTVPVGSGEHDNVTLAEFLDTCANEATSERPILRSTLEDVESKADIALTCLVNQVEEEREKTGAWLGKRKRASSSSMSAVPNAVLSSSHTSPAVMPPEKHDEFDYAMGQTSGKVVPAWDTDLNLRLQQLDSVLAASAASAHASSSSSSSSSSEGGSSISEKEKQPEEPVRQKPYACPSCDARFNSCGARNSHRRKVHQRHHLCRECDLAFGSAQKLERHLKTHTGVKEFRCETCGKEFMIERNLVLHYKLHLGQKDYMCAVCSRTYYTKSGLQAHTRQIHAPPGSGESGFSCNQCSETLPTKYDLMLHRKSSHAGAWLPEKCSVCSMSFRTHSELKRHHIAEHSNRPYACPHCTHRSKTQDKLDRHMVCHTAKEAFMCQHCDKKFVFKNSLKKHLEKGRCDVLKQKTGRSLKLDSCLLRANNNDDDSDSNNKSLMMMMMPPPPPPMNTNVVSGPPQVVEPATVPNLTTVAADQITFQQCQQ